MVRPCYAMSGEVRLTSSDEALARVHLGSRPGDLTGRGDGSEIAGGPAYLSPFQGSMAGGIGYHLTVRVESEQTGIEQTLEVCPQRDAVGALIVPACGRRDAMRCIESLGCLLLRDDAAVAVAVENHGPELSLPLPSGGRARLLCTTCSRASAFR